MRWKLASKKCRLPQCSWKRGPTIIQAQANGATVGEEIRNQAKTKWRSKGKVFVAKATNLGEA